MENKMKTITKRNFPSFGPHKLRFYVRASGHQWDVYGLNRHVCRCNYREFAVEIAAMLEKKLA